MRLWLTSCALVTLASLAPWRLLPALPLPSAVFCWLVGLMFAIT
jgi:hypothetical protein